MRPNACVHRPRIRARRWLGAAAVIVTAAALTVALAACSATDPANGGARAKAALDRAAAAARTVAEVADQTGFGPSRFWYVRMIQSADGAGFRDRETVETWFGFNGLSRTRSASPAADESGQDSLTVGDDDYGPGDGVGLPEALFTSSQLASLPSTGGPLRAAIEAGVTALNRQEDALRIKVRRTAGSTTTQLVRSGLTASQLHVQALFQTAASLLAGPVSAGVRSALYRLIATLPGLRDEGEVRDALGRLGTAVALGPKRSRSTISFDPATGELLSASLDSIMTQTIVARGVTSSLGGVPPGLAAVTGNAPAVLLARVSPHVGTAQTVFQVVQSTRNAPIEDTLLGPTAASCTAELFPGPSPKLSGGAHTSLAIGGLRGLAYRYSFGPGSIGRPGWCPGRYQLQILGLNGGQATAYFSVS